MDGQEDSFVIESAELPDHAIIALLKREHLLTRAKLNALYFEHITGERRLRSLKTQLRQVSHCASHAAMILALCIPAANAVLWHSSNFIEQCVGNNTFLSMLCWQSSAKLPSELSADVHVRRCICVGRKSMHAHADF